MTFPVFRYNPGQEPPFTIFVEHRDKSQERRWRPKAFAMLTPSLRTSGFLFALPPQDLQCFLLLLTFITPNGDCAATLPQLAEALGVSQAGTRARMERLIAARWHGQPVVAPHRFGPAESYAPFHGLLPVREEGPQEPAAPVLRAAPREAVIEHSRRTYARPREEVERQIAELNGWVLPVADEPAVSAEPDKSLHAALLAAGLLPHQAQALIAQYDAGRIRRQLAWLPYRGVRNGAGFLIAAVRNDYEAPRGPRSAPFTSSSGLMTPAPDGE